MSDRNGLAMKPNRVEKLFHRGKNQTSKILSFPRQAAGEPLISEPLGSGKRKVIHIIKERWNSYLRPLQKQII